MSKIRLKKTYKFKNKKKKIIHKFLFILILVIVISFYVVHTFNKKASPILIEYANLETKKLATIIINRAVSKQLAEDIKINDLIETTKNNLGEIQSVDFKPYTVNKILNTVTNTIQLNLKWLEEGKVDMIELPDTVTIDNNEENLKKGIIYEIPIGAITNNTFLGNLGPKIPVKLNLVGSVECSISTKITDYGINNAIIEIGVNAKVDEKVILPFTSETISINTTIPVLMKIIEGKVPDYYANGISKESSSLSVPIEE